MREIYRIVRMSLQAICRNAMRSALTCLGITIGIAAVIAMVEVGQGASYAIQQTIATIGANVVQIDPDGSMVGGVSTGSGGKVTLTPLDCDAMRLECSAIGRAAPSVDCRMQIVSGNRNWSPSTILGTTPDYLVVRNWAQLDEGEAFTDDDVRSAACVCLVGQTVVRELFMDQSPLGREIRAGQVRFKVIGVLSRKGANMTGRDQDDCVIAPWTTIKFRLSGSRQAANQVAYSSSSQVNSLNQLYPAGTVALYPPKSAAQAVDMPMLMRFSDLDDIWVSATSPDEVPQAMKQITQLLRERHRIQDGHPNDFRVRDLTETAETMASTSKRTTSFLLSVTLISLLVGGVGIMNMMLVTVTERTREIGLRLAVGARARDILRQFLMEAVMLCLLGGIAGIVIGRGVSITLAATMQWPTRPSLAAVIAAVTVSVSVGIIFGYYPAWRASRLDPIQALGYE
jgi:ABC-type antimicrobial peptide transport system permease subunit